MKLRIATGNTSTLNTRVDEYAELAVTHNIDILGLQETRIKPGSVASLRKMFKKRNYKLKVLPLQEGEMTHMLCFVSRWPMQLIETPDSISQKARVLLARIHMPGKPPVSVALMHLQHCRSAREETVRQVTSYLAERGGERILIGDWNCTPDQNPCLELLSSGQFHLTETIEEVEQSTRRCTKLGEVTEGRHIDYMIGTNRINVLQREQIETTSDHDVVLYEIETQQPRDENTV